jgi:hypothetical protein
MDFSEPSLSDLPPNESNEIRWREYFVTEFVNGQERQAHRRKHREGDARDRGIATAA